MLNFLPFRAFENILIFSTLVPNGAQIFRGDIKRYKQM